MNNLVEEVWERDVLIDFLKSIEHYEAVLLISKHKKEHITLYRDTNTDTCYLEMADE
jgi:hypothetical protein